MSNFFAIVCWAQMCSNVFIFTSLYFNVFQSCCQLLWSKRVFVFVSTGKFTQSWFLPASFLVTPWISPYWSIFGAISTGALLRSCPTKMLVALTPLNRENEIVGFEVEFWPNIYFSGSHCERPPTVSLSATGDVLCFLPGEPERLWF